MEALRFLIVSAVLLASGAAQAMGVTWSFQDAYFDDSTSLTGSFDYDSSQWGANSYSNVNLMTQGSGALSGSSYSGVTMLSGGIGFTSVSGDQSLGVRFDGSLSDAIGSIGIAKGGETLWTVIQLGPFKIPLPVDGRELVSGSLVAAGAAGAGVVSLVEPTTLAMFVIGLITLVTLRRRSII